MSLDNGYVTSEYMKKVAEQMRGFKQLSYEHMAIVPGDTVLDIGCGPGMDTIPLAQLVGDAGKVIAIDSDAKVLTEAEQAAEEAGCREWIDHLHGSALELPLNENSVSACRAERLLQVLPPESEQAVVEEMVRVTRPGGRIVLADADWPSASVAFSNSQLERRLMTFFALQMRPNGLAGRRLPALCRDHSLEELRLDVVPMVQLRLSDTPFGDWLINTAKAQGIMNELEATEWREELQQRERDGRFYACVNMVIASGKKAV